MKNSIAAAAALLLLVPGSFAAQAPAGGAPGAPPRKPLPLDAARRIWVTDKEDAVVLDARI